MKWLSVVWKCFFLSSSVKLSFLKTSVELSHTRGFPKVAMLFVHMMQCSRLSLKNEARNMKCETWNVKYEMWSTKHCLLWPPYQAPPSGYTSHNLLCSAHCLCPSIATAVPPDHFKSHGYSRVAPCHLLSPPPATACVVTFFNRCYVPKRLQKRELLWRSGWLLLKVRWRYSWFLTPFMLWAFQLLHIPMML